MTKTYTQLMKQIEGLKAEAEKMRRKEVAGVIARIREAIDHYGLTAADLGLAEGPQSRGGARKPRAAKAVKAAAPSTAPKYQDDAGRTWGGRGPRPKWLREALAAGRRLEEFAVS